MLNKYTYSPFGENTGLPGSVIGYTGQRYDAETGLYYYKARHYKPSIGRFLQPDPIGYEAGMNLYGYVHNDPVNRADPTGLLDEKSLIDHFREVLNKPAVINGQNIEWHSYSFSDGSHSKWYPPLCL